MSKNKKAPEGDLAALSDPVATSVDQVAPVEPVIEPINATANLVKVRILRDCVYGKCDEVVMLDAALAESLAGVVDADPSAVEYAESLK